MGVKKCFAAGCRNARSKNEKKTESSKSFFRFPEPEAARTAVWIAFTGKESGWVPNNYAFLCGDHFQAECFFEPPNRTRLKPTAVPTIPSCLVPCSITHASAEATHFSAFANVAAKKPSILLVGKRTAATLSSDDIASEKRQRLPSSVDELNTSFGHLSTSDSFMAEDIVLDETTVNIQFTAEMLRSNSGIVQLPEHWRALVFDEVTVFVRLDPVSLETVYTIGILRDLLVKIRVKNREYLGAEFGHCKPVTFQDVNDLVFAVEASSCCPYAGFTGHDSCELISRTKKTCCDPCTQYKKRYSSVENYVKRLRTRSASLTRERKKSSEKLRRRDSRIEKQEQVIRELRDLAKEVQDQNLIPPESAHLLRDFVEVAQKHKYDPAKYSSEFMDFAIRLHYCSPKAYGFLRDRGITLPHPDRIRVHVARLSKDCGFDLLILHCLREWAKLQSPDELDFSLIFDEMQLSRRSNRYVQSVDKVIGLADFGPFNSDLTDEQRNKVADHALVISARGMKRKLFQPIGIFFSNAQTPGSILKSILEEAVRLLDETGLNILSITSDAGTGNVAAFKLLGLNFDDPNASTVLINGKQRYVIMDPPHGLKAGRNGTFKRAKGGQLSSRLIEFIDEAGNVYEDEEGIMHVNFGHFRQMYDIDTALEKKGLRSHPRLKASMVNPDPFNVQSVRNAAVVLSETSVRVLEEFESQKKIFRTLATREYAKFFNRWFDYMNSSKGDRNPSRRPIRFENNVVEQIRKDRARLLLWKEKVPQKHRLANKTINYMVVTMNSVIRLSTDLLAKGYLCVEVKYLDNDAAERFFSRCRALGGGRNINPTIEQMMAFFRILAFHSMQKISEHLNANVEDVNPWDEQPVVGAMDVLQIAKEFRQQLDDARLLVSFAEYEPVVLVPEGLAPGKLDSIVQNVVYYLSGFASKRKSLEDRLCDACRAVLLAIDPAKELPAYAQLVDAKDRGGLHYVGEDFFEMVCDLEKIFRRHIDACLYQRPRETLLQRAEVEGIRGRFILLKRAMRFACTNECSWFEVYSDAATYYFQIRIHFYTKLMNDKVQKRGAKSSEPRSRKLKIVSA